MRMTYSYYNIANITLAILADSLFEEALPNYIPFRVTAAPSADITLLLGSDVSIHGEEIHAFESDYMHYRFLKGADSSYIIEFFDVNTAHTYLLETNAKCLLCKTNIKTSFENCFVLNNMLMVAFAFGAIHHNVLLFHASAVEHNGQAAIFLGKSGTGKSTHAALWINYIQNSTMINDDNPAVRIEPQNHRVYGTPWSGKMNCFRQNNFPLRSIIRLEQSSQNKIEPLTPVKALAAVLPSCSVMHWETSDYNKVYDLIAELIVDIPVFTLHCLPNKAAAEMAAETLKKE